MLKEYGMMPDEKNNTEGMSFETDNPAQLLPSLQRLQKNLILFISRLQLCYVEKNKEIAFTQEYQKYLHEVVDRMIADVMEEIVDETLVAKSETIAP